VQIDLAATVDGEEVPGGTATNLSHEVGSNQLLPGLDETVDGMSAGDSTTFSSSLVAGDFAGREAEVAVTVRTVKERELPALDDEFAGLASEFDSLDELREDVAQRLRRVRKLEQLYAARDKALEALVEASDVPAPEGVVKADVEGRKESMTDQLERMGATLEEYLESEGKSEAELDAEIRTAAEGAVRVQLVLDAFADAENLTVTDDEFGHEIVHRAQRAGMGPQQYYEQLIKAGAAGAVFSDVRRGKALATVLERITITDTNGEPVAVDELRGDEHDHEGHDHE
jgi:trigger factor